MPVQDEDMGLIIIPLSTENLPRELINETLVVISSTFKTSNPNLEISISNILFYNYTFSKNLCRKKLGIVSFFQTTALRWNLFADWRNLLDKQLAI